MLKSFILTLALSALGSSWAQAQSTHAFTNARIVPISGPVIEKGTLVVQEGKIVAVGPSVPIPAGAETHDLAGKTIMPGLVDSHSHIASPSGGTYRVARSRSSWASSRRAAAWSPVTA